VLTLLSLSQKVLDVDRSHVADGLEAIQARSVEDLAALDADRRAALIGAFVRGMRRLDVDTSLEVERQLLEAARLEPPLSAVFAMDSALSLLTVRGHLRWVLLASRLRWHDMQSMLAVFGTVFRCAIHCDSTVEIRHDARRCNVHLRCKREFTTKLAGERALLRQVCAEHERADGLEFVIEKCVTNKESR
jgi:hypothetical protein